MGCFFSLTKYTYAVKVHKPLEITGIQEVQILSYMHLGAEHGWGPKLSKQGHPTKQYYKLNIKLAKVIIKIVLVDHTHNVS